MESIQKTDHSKGNKMRKSIRASAIAAVCAGILALSGCSNDDSDNSDSVSTLQWGMWIASSDDQEVWQSIGDVGTEQTGVKVSLQGAPFDDYWTKIGTQLSSKDAPCIVTMQSGRISQYADSLVPIGELVENLDTEGFDDAALAGMTVDDTLYALPYDSGPAVMFYNADMFEELGLTPPGPEMTVSEFEEYGEAFKAQDKALFAPTIESPQLESMIYAYNGGTAIKKDGTYDLTDKTFQAGVDWIGSLVSDGVAVAADGTDVSADENAFYAQRAAMHVNGPWSLLDIAEKSKFTVGMTTLPMGENGVGSYSVGSGFAVPKSCQNQTEAAEAIVAMTSDDALIKLADSGRGFPSRAAVQSNWYDFATDLVNSQEAMEAIVGDAVALPSSTQSTEVLQLLSQYGVAALNGQKSAAAVFDEMQNQLD